MLTQTNIMELPASARIKFTLDVLEREKHSRGRMLGGEERKRKVEEIVTCITYLTHIDQSLARAKSIVEDHKNMCARLREAVERHELRFGEDTLDRLLIAELDRLKKQKLTQ